MLTSKDKESSGSKEGHSGMWEELKRGLELDIFKETVVRGNR